MCTATGKPPTLVCTIGDLNPGVLYHDQYGGRFVVTDCVDAELNTSGVKNTIVLNLDNGHVGPVYSDIKLGYDHKGRFYTSTMLNDWYYDAPQPDAVIPDAAQIDGDNAMPPTEVGGEG